MNEYKLTHIYVYPIKSFRGVELKEAFLSEEGIANDRRWMLVDEHNRFVSQRTLPKLALFSLKLNQNRIIISYEHHFVEIPLKIFTGRKIKVKIWDDYLEALHFDKNTDEWFFQILNKKLKLVYLPEHIKRERQFKDKKYNVAFSDSFPLLVIGSKSFDALNTVVGKTIAPIRFRPNLMFDTQQPFEEDHWQILRCDEVEINLVKPCVRCVIPTINLQNGEKETEVLEGLKKIREINKKILLGQNALVNSTGKLKVKSAWKVF